MNIEQSTPEDEMMKQIMFEIKRYENNQIEFTKATDDFIITSNNILDNESSNK